MEGADRDFRLVDVRHLDKCAFQLSRDAFVESLNGCNNNMAPGPFGHVVIYWAAVLFQGAVLEHCVVVAMG